jgi:Fe-Mn family superoxide dismutase
MLEHAFILDYGTKKADYIDSFLESVDWKIVEDRFAK